MGQIPVARFIESGNAGELVRRPELVTVVDALEAIIKVILGAFSEEWFDFRTLAFYDTFGLKLNPYVSKVA